MTTFTVDTEFEDEIKEEFVTPKKTSPRWVVYVTAAAGAVLFVVALVLGVLIGGSSSSDREAETVDSIRAQNSILDSVETLKDSQIKALNKLVADARISGRKASEYDLALLGMFGRQSEMQAVVDPVIDSVMSVAGNPDALTLLEEQLGENVYSSVTDPVERGQAAAASAQGFRDVSRLTAGTRRAAPSTVYMASRDNSVETYLVTTPIVGEHSTGLLVTRVTADTSSLNSLSSIELVAIADYASSGEASDTTEQTDPASASGTEAQTNEADK